MTPQSNTPEGKVTAAPDHKMYDEVLAAFMQFMRDELASNYLKGDRNGPNGWIHYKDKKGWLNELYYHVGKLQSAMMNADTERIKENCADIANLAMMTLDVNIDLTRYVPDEHYQSASKDAQIADLARQLESAREELERLRERLDDFGETEKCECDHTTPIVFNTHDDDGNATCPNCQIDYLNELITKSESKNKALVEALERIKECDSTLSVCVAIAIQALNNFKSQNP